MGADQTKLAAEVTNKPSTRFISTPGNKKRNKVDTKRVIRREKSQNSPKHFRNSDILNLEGSPAVRVEVEDLSTGDKNILQQRNGDKSFYFSQKRKGSGRSQNEENRLTMESIYELFSKDQEEVNVYEEINQGNKDIEKQDVGVYQNIYTNLFELQKERMAALEFLSATECENFSPSGLVQDPIATDETESKEYRSSDIKTRKQQLQMREDMLQKKTVKIKEANEDFRNRHDRIRQKMNDFDLADVLHSPKRNKIRTVPYLVEKRGTPTKKELDSTSYNELQQLQKSVGRGKPIFV